MENLKSTIENYELGMATSMDVINAYVRALSAFHAEEDVITMMNQELTPMARFICSIMSQDGPGWGISDFYTRRALYTDDAETPSPLFDTEVAD